MIAFNLEHWDQYFWEEGVKEEYSKIGYYSQHLRLSDGTIFPKARVIAVTTQPCYNFNFYTWSTYYDPGNELLWLEETLRQMEKDGEVGFIIAHIPPGDHSCLY